MLLPFIESLELVDEPAAGLDMLEPPMAPLELIEDVAAGFDAAAAPALVSAADAAPASVADVSMAGIRILNACIIGPSLKRRNRRRASIAQAAANSCSFT